MWLNMHHLTEWKTGQYGQTSTVLMWSFAHWLVGLDDTGDLKKKTANVAKILLKRCHDVAVESTGWTPAKTLWYISFLIYSSLTSFMFGAFSGHSNSTCVGVGEIGENQKKKRMSDETTTIKMIVTHVILKAYFGK